MAPALSSHEEFVEFDLRTLDTKIARGEITQEQYDQFLKSLPDEEGNFEQVGEEESE